MLRKFSTSNEQRQVATALEQGVKVRAKRVKLPHAWDDIIRVIDCSWKRSNKKAKAQWARHKR